jgi:hypothetical protein
MNEDWLDYIVALYPEALSKLELKQFEQHNLKWRDSASLLREIAAIQKKVCNKCCALLSGLRDGGFLSVEEMAASVPKIELNVIDDRGQRKVPLPKIQSPICNCSQNRSK